MPNVEYEDDNKPSNDNRRAKVKKVLQDLSLSRKVICVPLIPSVEYDNKPCNHDYHAEKKIPYGDIYHAIASASDLKMVLHFKSG